MTEFVLVSPDGNETRTESTVYRSRLLAQGYAETETADHATDTPANPPQATQTPSQTSARRDTKSQPAAPAE
jgi:hypothetical protein